METLPSLSASGKSASPESGFSEAFTQELERLFALRRDVRRFRDAPVPADLVTRVLSSMNMAPSVGLSQPWRLVLFESAKARAAARAAFETANAEALAEQTQARARLYARLKLSGIEVAPVQFAVFADAETDQGGGLGRRTMPEMLHYSAVCAVMQAWLAARALGLGLGWISILDVAAIKTAADVDPAWSLIGYFCLGYPETACDDVPELERAGWESRRPLEDWIQRR